MVFVISCSIFYSAFDPNPRSWTSNLKKKRDWLDSYTSLSARESERIQHGVTFMFLVKTAYIWFYFNWIIIIIINICCTEKV